MKAADSACAGGDRSRVGDPGIHQGQPGRSYRHGCAAEFDAALAARQRRGQGGGGSRLHGDRGAAATLGSRAGARKWCRAVAPHQGVACAQSSVCTGGNECLAERPGVAPDCWRSLNARSRRARRRRGRWLPPSRLAHCPSRPASGAVMNAIDPIPRPRYRRPGSVADEGPGDCPDRPERDGAGHRTQRGVTRALRKRGGGRQYQEHRRQ